MGSPEIAVCLTRGEGEREREKERKRQRDKESEIQDGPVGLTLIRSLSIILRLSLGL